jgi:hypothetical protein
MLTKVLWIVLALIAGWWLWKGFVRLRSGDNTGGLRSGARKSPPGPRQDLPGAQSGSTPVGGSPPHAEEASRQGGAWRGAARPDPDSARAARDPFQGAADPSGPSQDVESPAQELVACAHCGAWSGRADALERGGLWYCDEAHAQAGPKKDA